MIGSTNAQPKVEIYTAGDGIEIENNEVSIDTVYPSQNLSIGTNTLNNSIYYAIARRLPILINNRLLTFYSDTPSSSTYNAVYENITYTLITDGLGGGVYSETPITVMTIHRN